MSGGRNGVAPVVIEGAMTSEIDWLTTALDDPHAETWAGNPVTVGTVDGYPVVVVRTHMGMTNAALATVAAIERCHPCAVLNQGTAGGHDPDLHLGDIVLSAQTVEGPFCRSRVRLAGEGSDPDSWAVLPVEVCDGREWNFVRSLTGDPTLLAVAQSVPYTGGRVVPGCIMSGDMWNREADRIAWFHRTLGTSCEEMEAFAVAQTCCRFGVPFLGIRVIANVEFRQEAYDVSLATACQQFTHATVRALIARQ